MLSRTAHECLPQFAVISLELAYRHIILPFTLQYVTKESFNESVNYRGYPSALTVQSLKSGISEKWVD